MPNDVLIGTSIEFSSRSSAGYHSDSQIDSFTSGQTEELRLIYVLLALTESHSDSEQPDCAITRYVTFQVIDFT